MFAYGPGPDVETASRLLPLAGFIFFGGVLSAGIAAAAWIFARRKKTG